MAAFNPITEAVVAQVKESYKVHKCFNKVEEKLKEAIEEALDVQITWQSAETAAAKYFTVASCNEEALKGNKKYFNVASCNEEALQRKKELEANKEATKVKVSGEVLKMIKDIFETAFIALLARKMTHRIARASRAEFFEKYPNFETEIGMNETELGYLREFHYIVRVFLSVNKAKRNKGRCLHIGQMLDGSGRDLTTGSGQAPEMDWRVAIYEKEGNITAEKRPPRNRSKGHKRPHQDKGPGQYSTKRLRTLTLDDVTPESLSAVPPASASAPLYALTGEPGKPGKSGKPGKPTIPHVTPTHRADTAAAFLAQLPGPPMKPAPSHFTFDATHFTGNGDFDQVASSVMPTATSAAHQSQPVPLPISRWNSVESMLDLLDHLCAEPEPSSTAVPMTDWPSTVQWTFDTASFSDEDLADLMLTEWFPDQLGPPMSLQEEESEQDAYPQAATDPTTVSKHEGQGQGQDNAQEKGDGLTGAPVTDRRTVSQRLRAG